DSAYAPAVTKQLLQTNASLSLLREEGRLITFRLKTQTPNGKQIVDSLLDHRQELPCECRQNESCIVEITEMPDQRIALIVNRPRHIAHCRNWNPYATVEGIYARRFD